jgi:hypothetical protein
VHWHAKPLAWTIEYDPRAIDDLNHLDRPVRREIVDYLENRMHLPAIPASSGKHYGTTLPACGVTACGIIALSANYETRH